MVHVTWGSDKHEVPRKLHLQRSTLRAQVSLGLRTTSRNEQRSTNEWCKSPFRLCLAADLQQLKKKKGEQELIVCREEGRRAERQDCRQSSEKSLNLNWWEQVLFLKRGQARSPAPVKFVCFLITQLHRSFFPLPLPSTMICLPVKHENRTEAKCTFIILRGLLFLYLQIMAIFREQKMFARGFNVAWVQIHLSSFAPTFYMPQCVVFFWLFFLLSILRLNSFIFLMHCIWFWSLNIAATHLWLCIARSHACRMFGGTDKSRGGKVALRRGGGVKSAAEDAASSCSIYVFLLEISHIHFVLWKLYINRR